ncbi:MAG: shikimate kinase [Candidatus Omnitrophota bacterium]
MNNIYIVGFMGTGKTTIANLLSVKLGRELIEMDDVIEKRESKKISDIFSQAGEPYFRKKEKELLCEISKRKGLIVSCGGGLICDEANLKTLKDSGIIINLNADIFTIYERTKDSSRRPILNVKDPLDEIRDLYEKRKPSYKKADFSIDTGSKMPEEIACEIISLLEKKGDRDNV